MFIYAKAMISIRDASRNFKTITDVVSRHGVAYIMRSLDPVFCVVSAKRFIWSEAPEKIPMMTVTEANQKFNNLLKEVSYYGVICLTKRGDILYYVIDASAMEEYLSNSDDMIDMQIAEFYVGFSERYRTAEELVNRIERFMEYD